MDNMPDGRVRQGHSASFRYLRVASGQVVCKKRVWINCCAIPPLNRWYLGYYTACICSLQAILQVLYYINTYSTMRIIYANIHKIIVLSSSFLGFFHFVSHFLTDIMPYCMFCPTCKAADTAKVQCLPPVICTEG